jgi:hypothetical protein
MLLRTDAPNSLHHGARFWTSPGSWKAWGVLDAALAGSDPNQAAWGVDRFQYLREHPAEARIFDAFMANFPDRRHQTLAVSYDFSEAKMIVDIGGGNAEALRRILERFPRPRGLVFDRDDVVAAIPPDARLGGRIEVQGGNFFEHAPEGGDIYLVIRVLHNWTDDDCIRILRTCRAAMTPDARLLIVEQILEPDPSLGRPSGYLVDTHMMAMFGAARERTESEFRELLQSSGFALGRAIETASPVWIMEAMPA